MKQPMGQEATSLEINQPQTPGQLADLLRVSLIIVLKALVGRSRYVLPTQAMEVQFALDAARDLGFIVRGNAICCPSPPPSGLKRNWPAFRLSVQRRQLRELYHFTAADNLAGIVAAGGLMSRRRMAERHIQAIQNNWGGPEKERALGADYICLSLTKHWAMMCSLIAGGAEPPALLVIQPRVIWYNGTCFSPGNSARRDISAAQLQRWDTERHFDALFSNTRSGWPCDLQAEILVRDEIPLDDVRQIVFRDRKAHEAVRHIAGLDRSSPHIGKVLISDRYFPLDMRQSDAGTGPG